MLCSLEVLSANYCFTDNWDFIIPVFAILIPFGIFVGLITSLFKFNK